MYAVRSDDTVEMYVFWDYCMDHCGAPSNVQIRRLWKISAKPIIEADQDFLHDFKKKIWKNKSSKARMRTPAPQK